MKLTEAKLKQMIIQEMSRSELFAKGLEKSIPQTKQGGIMYGLRGEKRADVMQKTIKYGREIKKLFAEYADQQYLKTLKLYHYRRIEGVENFFTDVKSKDEISCIAYEPGESFTFFPPHDSPDRYMCFEIQGRITLLVNDMDQLVSGHGKEYTDFYPDRTRDSGANKGVRTVPSSEEVRDYGTYVLSAEDFEPDQTGFGMRLNEALVDNWRISSVVVNTPEKKQKIEDMMTKGQIPTHPITIASSKPTRYR